jgi:hypothetical protein
MLPASARNSELSGASAAQAPPRQREQDHGGADRHDPAAVNPVGERPRQRRGQRQHRQQAHEQRRNRVRRIRITEPSARGVPCAGTAPGGSCPARRRLARSPRRRAAGRLRSARVPAHVRARCVRPAHAAVQVLGLDARAGGQQLGALDHVAQLAHVARPWVRCSALAAPGDSGLPPSRKCSASGRMSARAFGQRRHRQFDGVER